MTKLSMEDRFAVLEERLKDAESAIFGCRAMLNYCRRIDQQLRDQKEPNKKLRGGEGNPFRKGLYPGQIDNHIEADEDEECST